MAITPLPGTVKPAPAGLLGFDVNGILSHAQAVNFKNAGYAFCVRYLPRTAALVAGNLTNQEALGIVQAGLALMAVQHVALPGWAPTAALGTQYGSFAATYAQQTVGLPAGMNIWLDLEEPAANTPAADVIAYCQAWYTAVQSAGYVPGVYVGYGAILTAEQLYSKLSFQHYWRAYNGPQVATRGYQILQKTQKAVNGLEIDPNVTQNDNLGGTALWLSL
jgi:hypothetical protein